MNPKFKDHQKIKYLGQMKCLRKESIIQTATMVPCPTSKSCEQQQAGNLGNDGSVFLQKCCKVV